jgi:hypothetical protein
VYESNYFLNDFDPENEQTLLTVVDDADRDSRFKPAKAGDQVFNVTTNKIEVFNGSVWIAILSEINLKASNGLAINSTNPDAPEVELGGDLTKETAIGTTFPTPSSLGNTLAITGLEPIVDDLNYNVLISDPTSEVLKRISFENIFLNKAIQILENPTEIQPLTNKKEGDLIWVKDFDGNINPTLLIYNATSTGIYTPWIPVTNDFDPENELYVISVATLAARDINAKFLPIPEIGDQVYIIDQNLLQVYNGTNWFTINLKASNGLSINTTNPDAPEMELGGALNKATSIATTATETLAITGLEPVTTLNYDVIVSDP